MPDRRLFLLPPWPLRELVLVPGNECGPQGEEKGGLGRRQVPLVLVRVLVLTVAERDGVDVVSGQQVPKYFGCPLRQAVLCGYGKYGVAGIDVSVGCVRDIRDDSIPVPGRLNAGGLLLALLAVDVATIA